MRPPSDIARCLQRGARRLPDARPVGRDRGARQPGRAPTTQSRDAAGRAPAARARHALAAAQPPPPAVDRRDRGATSRRVRQTLYGSVARLLAPADAEPLAARADELREAGVPMDLATRIAAPATMSSTFDIVEVSRECGLDVADRGGRRTSTSASELQLHWLRDQIVALPRSDRWAALARAALRDDLNGLHRTLTSDVLKRRRPGRGRPRARRRLDRARTRRRSATSPRWPTCASDGSTT